MNANTRQFGLVGVAVIGLLIGCGWAYTRLHEARSRASAAMIEAKAVQTYADQITTLRRSSDDAKGDTDALSVDDRIHEAARSTQLPDDAIVRIDPERPIRTPGSAWAREPTRLTLRDVSMAQVLGLVHHLESHGDMSADSLRLTSRGSGNAPETWQAEIVISQMKFKPEPSR